MVRIQDVRERILLWEVGEQGQTAEEGQRQRQRQRAEVADKWRECYCEVRRLPRRSALSTAVAAGFQALPQLLPMAYGWQTLQELPEEINLTKDLCFHSHLICPITNDVATKDNPAQRLQCGHVILMSTQAHLSFHSRIPFLWVQCPFCRQISFISDIGDFIF